MIAGLGGQGDGERVREIGADDAGADEEDLDDLHETLLERFVGLSEMFPERVRSGVGNVIGGSYQALKGGVRFGRSALWVVSTSLAIGALPYLIEKERMDMETQQIQQQRQMLLGPSAAMAQNKK